MLKFVYYFADFCELGSRVWGRFFKVKTIFLKLPQQKGAGFRKKK